MTWRSLTFMLTGFAAGMLISWFVIAPNLSPTRALPRVARATVRDSVRRSLEIRSDTRYDVACTLTKDARLEGELGEVTLIRRCRILGVTGHDGYDQKRVQGPDLVSSGSKVAENPFFDNWLALELPDGRLKFVRTSSVRYFEESPREAGPGVRAEPAASVVPQP